MRSHVESVHEKLRPFTCEKCQKSFGKKCLMNDHIQRVHSEIRPYKCDICDKNFAIQKALDAHKRKLHNTRNICNFCGKIVSGKLVLENHINSFHLENKYIGQ